MCGLFFVLFFIGIFFIWFFINGKVLLLEVFIEVIICIEILFFVDFIGCFWICIVFKFCVLWLGIFDFFLFFWEGVNLLLFFLVGIGLWWGLFVGGFFFSFLWGMGEEWGVDFVKVVGEGGEGGEGGRGLSEIGYFFFNIIGERLGLFCV